MAGTQVDEVDATLLTLKGISDRPVWSDQFRESAVACQSQAGTQVLLAKISRCPSGDARRSLAVVGGFTTADVRVQCLLQAQPWTRRFTAVCGSKVCATAGDLFDTAVF